MGRKREKLVLLRKSYVERSGVKEERIKDSLSYRRRREEHLRLLSQTTENERKIGLSFKVKDLGVYHVSPGFYVSIGESL